MYILCLQARFWFDPSSFQIWCTNHTSFFFTLSTYSKISMTTMKLYEKCTCSCWGTSFDSPAVPHCVELSFLEHKKVLHVIPCWPLASSLLILLTNIIIPWVNCAHLLTLRYDSMRLLWVFLSAFFSPKNLCYYPELCHPICWREGDFYDCKY